MTNSKIKMNNIDGQWCWSVSVNGPLGRSGTGKNNDYCIAYQDAFDFILKCDYEGVPESIYPMLKVFGLIASIVLSFATYLGVS